MSWMLGLALSFALVGERVALAQEPASPLVRLRYVDAPAVTPLVTRLSAELRVAGFVVERATTDGAAGYAELRVSVERERVELEITSHASGASSHVVLVGTAHEGPALALQATEFLRAGRLPRVTPPEPAPPPRATPRAPPVPPPPARGRALVDVGGAWMTNVGAGDRLWLLSLGAGYAFAERLSLSLGVDVPLGSATFRASRGAADYRLWVGAVRADYAWLQFRGGEASLGLGVGAARITSSGRPDSPLEGLRPEVWALALEARLGVQLRVSSELAIFARTRVVTLSPNPVVALLAEERRLGAPALSFELGARLGGRAQDGAGAFRR